MTAAASKEFFIATYGSRFLIKSDSTDLGSEIQNIEQRGNDMQFKDLEWEDIISDGVIACSTYELNICGWIKIEFRINHEPKENKYYLYSFGKGSIRRLMPEKYGSVESAKNAAYRIYSNEMSKIKKAIDYLITE